MTVKKNRGRPLKFTNKRTLQKKIEEYFKEAEKKGKPLTVTGLALALDTCRDTLLEYQGKEEYSDTIKKAKLRVQAYAEEQLFVGNANGAKFSLNVNYGWTEEKKKIIAGDEDNPLKVISNLERANKIASTLKKADI